MGAIALALLFATTAVTPLVSGNGLGYVVVDAGTGAVTKLYAHPYRFMRKNAANADGVPTTNLVRRAEWTQAVPNDAIAHTTYRAESHVIESHKGSLTAHFFMPFGLSRNATVTAAGSACLNVAWEHEVKSTKTVEGALLFAFRGVPEQVLVVPIADPGTTADTTKLCSSGFAFLVLESDRDAAAAVKEWDAWKGSRSTAELVGDEVKALEAWRVAPYVGLRSDEERRFWRHGETILRMAQIREPNRPGRRNHGLINASLPNGVWFIPWVRDGAYAVVGLTRMGHHEEAKLALDAWLNAAPMGRMLKDVRRAPYQISTVRYFGDGTEDADYSSQPYQNVEFDSWGLALWAIGEYVATTNDKAWLNMPAAHGSVYVTARDFIVKPLLANTDPYGGGEIITLDSSVWEQNSMPRMHYAASTIAAINGLRAFKGVAELQDDRATVKLLDEKLATLARGFAAAYVRDGKVFGTVEDSPKNSMDGALLEGINGGVITTPALVQSTLERLEALKTGSGGYRRVTGPTEYEKHEFVLIDYALARAYLRLGQAPKAEEIVQRVTHRALADNGFIPEMYVSFVNDFYKGAVGDPAGAVPMVGYGPGVHMLYLLERGARR